MLEEPNWRCVVDAHANVAECPIWSPAERALYWIDVHEPSVNRTKLPGGETTRWLVPGVIGSYALHDTGQGALVALHSGIYTLSFATGVVAPVHDAPYDRAKFRFNDGRCDALGRFLVGTVRTGYTAADLGTASFWRVDERGIRPLIGGITVANGIAFASDNATLYLADSPLSRLLAFDYDLATGTAVNRRVFAAVPEGSGPDGAATDVAGGYWVALCYAGRVLRFRADGSLDRELRAPTSFPTMVAFGGDDYRTLFLTTGTRSARGDRPATTGAIYACEVDVAGRPEPRLRTGG